jgi:hypothetical protein
MRVLQGLSRAVSGSEQIRVGERGNIQSAQKLWKKSEKVTFEENLP